jgi:hypothetical protein
VTAKLLSGRRVLVVEDELLVLLVIEDMLTGSDFDQLVGTPGTVAPVGIRDRVALESLATFCGAVGRARLGLARQPLVEPSRERRPRDEPSSLLFPEPVIRS